MMKLGRDWMVRRIGRDWANGETLGDGIWTRLDNKEDWESLGKWGDLG